MHDAAPDEPNDDAELLRRYVAEGDEAAFAEVVERNVGLVYAAALRQLGGSVHRAREVTQLVFIDLVQKARGLARRDDLAGWLYTSTHYAAAKLKRGEERRERREQEALMMQNSLPDGADAAAWEELRPVLDDAMLALCETDRAVLLQRFFHGRRFAEIGRGLATSEDAARMRVERALEKLRAVLGQRGITSTTAALAGTLAHPMIAAAPAGLAASVTGAALAGGTAAGAAGASILFMSTTKWVVGGVVAVLALGGGTVAYQRAQEAEAQRIAQAAERERAETQARAEKQRAETARKQSEAAPRAAAAEAAPVTPPAPAEPAKAAPRGGGGGRMFLGQPVRNADGTVTIAEVGAGGILAMQQTPLDPVEREKLIRDMAAQSTNSAYGKLYELAGWTEAQQAQFRDIMYARKRFDENLFAAAVREARAKNPQFTRADQYEIFEAMNAQNERENLTAVRTAMGEEAGQALERYQKSALMRHPVGRLTTALAEAGTPLAPAQAEQLIEVLAANARGFDGRTDILALNLDAAVAQAPGLLSEAHVATLRGIVTQMQEQKKLERERNMAPAGSLKSKGQ